MTGTMQDELSKRLKNEEVTLKYIKKDGSERIMKCTLKETLIPQTKNKQGEKSKDSSILTVFDLEKNEWRAIDVNRIISL